MMFFGFYLIFNPLTELLQVLPGLSFLGKFVIMVFALAVGIFGTSITIIVSWIAHRPKCIIFLVIIIAVYAITAFYFGEEISAASAKYAKELQA